MDGAYLVDDIDYVALRKESVDRNTLHETLNLTISVALRKESVDRNLPHLPQWHCSGSRSPQGERG